MGTQILAGRQKKGGIDAGVVEAHAPVQVRAGGAPCHPHRADDRAARYPLAGLDGDTAQVAIHGDESLAMVDEYGVAIEEIIAGGDHRSVRRRAHRRTAGGGDVQAAVRIARLAVEKAPQPEGTG